MEVQKNIKQCETCKDDDATTLCLDCHSYFCEACYKCVHDIKQNNSHKTEKIDLFIPIDTKCPEHEGILMNLFCIDEKGNIYYNINIISI